MLVVCSMLMCQQYKIKLDVLNGNTHKIRLCIYQLIKMLTRCSVLIGAMVFTLTL